MGKLMEKTEPEIVDSIMAKCHADDRCSIRQEHGGTIKIGFREMGDHNQVNPLFFQIFPGQYGTVDKIALPCNVPQGFRRDCPFDVSVF